MLTSDFLMVKAMLSPSQSIQYQKESVERALTCANCGQKCAHVCFYVCSDVGVTTRPEDANETYCYMLDRMVNHFLPFIQEKQDVSLE
ncbi:protein NinF [Escherichia coli]|uniref:protein NinF n=1 Tax=Escherichia coli TaxID=562 RepID=UPI001067E08E|nr:hypothetical protein [Escherichia coli]MDN1078063.1 hypothetical protein [Escherichia coli]TEV73742.1 hypothetical protein E2129_16705 [Escherichia coli]